MPFRKPNIPDDFIYDTLASAGVAVFRNWPTVEEIKASKYHFFAFKRDGMEKGEGAFSFVERLVVSYVFPSTSETAAELEDILDVLIEMKLNIREATEDTLLFKDTKEEYTVHQITVTRPRVYFKKGSFIDG
ncbi:hypothetical protein PWEIH_00650 [Listeria weihenstephanensis FSL R9-0317]|uniref:Phage protein n=1 Tax=Listeria weihenstephanensis TaxID=1006155 RepID=A0A1S7FT16_9LIST|nr:hypothetical protein [Listeria weihenstephanensis]AQY50507.1 hypothetical protein UE46_05340 [Listeria phage LWP01] [Listeria weihenstephanensis]AQY52653.1 hypothetical protein UE46_p05340 [Listeria phage LWP01]EUJ41526.1 hypothetical protein PWEIH_00650 [Listeria weihenstephanensis FSL R9-0317]